jgi:hypothetical protein
VADVSTPHGPKIDELYKIAHTLTERVDSIRAEIRDHGTSGAKLAEVLSAVSTRVALLEQQISEVKSWKDQVIAIDLKTEVFVLKENVKKLQDASDRVGTRVWAIVAS